MGSTRTSFSLSGVSLDGVDILFAITQKAMQEQIDSLHAKGHISGNKQDSHGEWTILSIPGPKGSSVHLEGKLEVPQINFAVNGQPNEVKITFGLTDGSLSAYMLENYAPILVKGTFSELRWSFFVNLNIAALEHDRVKEIQARKAENAQREAAGKPPLPVPSIPGVVKKLYDNPTARDFTPMALFVDFENADLANYDPAGTHMLGWVAPKTPDSSPMKDQLSKTALVKLLELHFKAMKGADNPYILGYGMQGGGAAPKGPPIAPPPAPPAPGPFVPSSASFSTFDHAPAPGLANPDELNTLNILLMTDGRHVAQNTGLLSSPLVISTEHTGVVAIDAGLIHAQLTAPVLKGVASSVRNFMAGVGAIRVKSHGQPFKKLEDEATTWATSFANGTWEEQAFDKVGLTWSLSVDKSDDKVVGSDSGIFDINLAWTQKITASITLQPKQGGGVQLVGKGEFSFSARIYENGPGGTLGHLGDSQAWSFSIDLSVDESTGTISSTKTWTPGTLTKSSDTNWLAKIGDAIGGNVDSWESTMRDKIGEFDKSAIDRVGDGIAKAMDQIKNRAALPFGDTFSFTGFSVDAIGNLVSSVDWVRSV